MIQNAEYTPHQNYLSRCFDELKALIGDIETTSQGGCTSIPEPEGSTIPSALHLQRVFRLSEFEFWSIICCAGCEYDSSLASLCKERYQVSLPTVSFLLSIIPQAHWDAFSPEKALRKAGLITLETAKQHVLSNIYLPEKVLHFLNGYHILDPDLIPWCFPLEPVQEEIPEQLNSWLNSDVKGHATLNCYGPDVEQIKTLVSAMLHKNAFGAYSIDASILDLDAGLQEHLFKLCLRDALLSRMIWVIDVGVFQTPGQERALKRLSTLCADSLVISSRSPVLPDHNLRHIEIKKDSLYSQVSQWESILEDTPINGSFKKILGLFTLSSSQIQRAVKNITGVEDPQTAQKMLWDACRRESRVATPGFIERIESDYTWDDLVLPDSILIQIKSIVMQLKHRFTVIEEWGFGRKSSRGLGVAALFYGPSGTGKTLAAEVLAKHLNLDLYKIDLSSVVSKYIGETEKNLARVFDTAIRANAILLFDEADALFGRRTEIKDAHDRYANIEVSYLLQRMENFSGLSILTTNLRENIDDAFARRIKFSISFPFPDQTLRRQIWKRIIPKEMPVSHIDYAKLAQLRICGGNIKNVALHCAYIAADSGQPLNMDHVLRAARIEYAKLERPVTETEIKNWKDHEQE